MSQKWKTPRKRKNSAPLATCSNKVSKPSIDRLPLSQPTNRTTTMKKTGATGKADDPVLDCCDICLKRMNIGTDNDDDSFVFTCTECKHSSHGKCLDFEESCLDLISAVYKAISWTCKECQELARSAGARGKVTNRVNSSANLTNELNVIRARLAALENFVFDLTSKASVASSVVTDTRSDHDSTSPGSWSSVVQESKKPATSNNIPIADVIKAVHGDLMNKKHREKNIIITGLKPSPTIGDKDLFRDMCASQLGINPIPDPIFCRRLGSHDKKPSGSMAPLIQKRIYVQPLLVTFSNAEHAAKILTLAASLRQSKSEYVRTSVYINRDLTKAEAAAEYEYRQRRRAKAKASLDSTSRPLSAVVILPPALTGLPVPAPSSSSSILDPSSSQQSGPSHSPIIVDHSSPGAFPTTSTSLDTGLQAHPPSK